MVFEDAYSVWTAKGLGAEPPCTVAARSITLPMLLCAGFLFSSNAIPNPAGQSPATVPNIGCGPQVCDQGAMLRTAYAKDVAHWPRAETTSDTPFQEMAPYERPKVDRDAPWVQIGEALFFDPLLSSTGQFACASCHHPDLAFTDGLRAAVGTGRTTGQRNTPTLLDKATQPSFMWDGVVDSLEHQALLPIASPTEMASQHEDAAGRVNAHPEYGVRIRQLTNRSEVVIADVATALAAYQRTLARGSRFDRFIGGERRVFSDQQIFGLHLFRTKARCMTCHSGPRLTDDQFHNLGLHFYGRSREDLGRFLITGDPADVGAFRTPSLRHLSRTKPYTHNGLIPTLQGVVNLYDHGGARPRPRKEFADDPLFPETSALLPELGLTKDEKAALIAFLETL